MNGNLYNAPRCPLCLSRNAVPISLQTFAFTGAGGLVGGIVGAAAGKDKSGGQLAGTVAAGALAGAMAGLSTGKLIQKEKPGGTYLCLDCFRSFVKTPVSRKRRSREHRKNRAGVI
jgi:uncharacterized protein YcfJ